jgi:hypothetical protein
MQKYAPFEHNDHTHISIMGKAIHFLQSGFVPKTWHIQNPIEREQARIISTWMNVLLKNLTQNCSILSYESEC